MCFFEAVVGHTACENCWGTAVIAMPGGKGMKAEECDGTFKATKSWGETLGN